MSVVAVVLADPMDEQIFEYQWPGGWGDEHPDDTYEILPLLEPLEGRHFDGLLVGAVSPLERIRPELWAWWHGQLLPTLADETLWPTPACPWKRNALDGVKMVGPMEFLACNWGFMVSTPDDLERCTDMAVRRIMLHDGGAEMLMQFCQRHADRVALETTPRDELSP